MNRDCLQRAAHVRKCIAAFLGGAAIAHAFVPFANARAERERLAPQLRPGQTFAYVVSFQSDRDINTQSTVLVPNLPGAEKMTAMAALHLEVLAVHNGEFHLRTSLQPFSPAPGKAPAPTQTPSMVEFVLDSNGSASQIVGLDSLPANEQAAWREWLARFAASLTFPKNGIRPGDTWESEEPETAPSPIAGLAWRKKMQYVRDEPCPEAHATPQGELSETLQPAEPCAVILATATLQQKSSRKNATPEDYKLNHLRTQGTATGSNQTILYISRATGLLMRSSETATQSMSVTISLANGGNQLRYDIHAQSHARILFLANSEASPH